MMRTYKEYIENLKNEWIGKKVKFENKYYTVVDVDYNGALLIDKPHYYTESFTAGTTAISKTMLENSCN